MNTVVPEWRLEGRLLLLLPNLIVNHVLLLSVFYCPDSAEFCHIYAMFQVCVTVLHVILCQMLFFKLNTLTSSSCDFLSSEMVLCPGLGCLVVDHVVFVLCMIRVMLYSTLLGETSTSTIWSIMLNANSKVNIRHYICHYYNYLVWYIQVL
jgi:hypothetical protein